MDKTFKTIPQFKNEREEKKFWEKADSTKYIDWTKAVIAQFPNLKPTIGFMHARHRLQPYGRGCADQNLPKNEI